MPKMPVRKPVVQTPTVEDTWEQRMLMVREMNHQEPSLRVKAQCFGSLCVYPWKTSTSWEVAHISTGVGIVPLGTVEEAKKLGGYLQRRFCLRLKKATDKESLRAVFDDPHRDWLKACSDAKIFLPPPQPE